MERMELLQQRYEDARFALFMEPFIAERAKQLTEENERLKHDPNFVVPDHLLELGLKLIRRGRRIGRNRHTAVRLKRAVQRIALVCFLAALLVTAACAVSPALRIHIRNLVVEVTDISMNFRDMDDFTTSAVPNQYTLANYILPELPEGFKLADQGEDDLGAWLQFDNVSGNMIRFTVFATDYMDWGIDTENTSSVETVQIGNYDCTLITADNVIKIYFPDNTYCNFISVETTGLDESTAVQLVRGLSHR